jgi:hypothetical protein
VTILVNSFQQGEFNRKNIHLENLIPNNDYIPLLTQQLTDIANNPSHRSAQQLIINNNYHNIFDLDHQLINRLEN